MGVLPRPVAESSSGGVQTAVFAGGCFWTVEATFAGLKGIQSATPGYAGGVADDARYELVASGETGHAESVRVVFDSSVIRYGDLLRVFFGAAHDPTQRDRQGPDWGRQYRSAIFFADEGQRRAAESYIRQLNDAHVFSSAIATEVVPLKAFYPAEAEHLKFVRRNPDHPYVMAHWPPKRAVLQKHYSELLR